MKSVPSLNLSKLSQSQNNPAVTNNNGMNQRQLQSARDTQRVNGERGFILDFFEKFHDAHEELTSITTFTRDDFFKESYMIEALAVGLPHCFVSAANQDYTAQLSARSGRSSNATATLEQQTLHMELAMYSNLKAYFKEHQLDISDIVSLIKQEKRIANNSDYDNRDNKHLSKAYWQTATLILTAFYLDHSQNEYLADFFSQKLQKSISKLLLCMNIVQSLLGKSEVIQTEEEEEAEALWGTTADGEDISMELAYNSKNDMDDILNADTSAWDPFRDAHKFEALATAEQKARQASVQAQFDLIKKQEDEERDRQDEYERTEDLEASI